MKWNISHRVVAPLVWPKEIRAEERDWTNTEEEITTLIMTNDFADSFFIVKSWTV